MIPAFEENDVSLGSCYKKIIALLPGPHPFIGRIAKWGVRLRTFDLCYKPRNAIKGQVLVDFVLNSLPHRGPR